MELFIRRKNLRCDLSLVCGRCLTEEDAFT
jgi:hypothetical protein